jgi:hypothetical protein
MITSKKYRVRKVDEAESIEELASMRHSQNIN